jgi:hypothetical protein
VIKVPEEKRTLERPGHRREEKIKIGLQEVTWGSMQV